MVLRNARQYATVWPMEIANALRTACDELGWNATKLASEAGVTEAAARRWLSGEAMPGGDVVIRLQRLLPRFNELLAIDGEAGAA